MALTKHSANKYNQRQYHLCHHPHSNPPLQIEIVFSPQQFRNFKLCLFLKDGAYLYGTHTNKQIILMAKATEKILKNKVNIALDRLEF